MNKRSILPLLTVGVATLALGACDMGYPAGGGYATQAYAAPGYAPAPTPIYESDYPPPAPVYGGSAINVVVPLGHEHDDHYRGGGDFHGGPPRANFHPEGHGAPHGGEGGGFHPEHASAPARENHGPSGHNAPSPQPGGDHEHDHGQH